MYLKKRVQLVKPENIREYTSGNVRNNWSQGYCVQTALNIISVFSSLAAGNSASNLRLFWLQNQLLNLADKQDVYILQQIIKFQKE